jgi:hypothetical protein
MPNVSNSFVACFESPVTHALPVSLLSELRASLL